MADILTEIMTNDPSGDKLVGFAQQKAEILVRNGLTRSQIRNIFTEVRKVEAMWTAEGKRSDALRRLNMLKPKLDYQVARSQ